MNGGLEKVVEQNKNAILAGRLSVKSVGAVLDLLEGQILGKSA